MFIAALICPIHMPTSTGNDQFHYLGLALAITLNRRRVEIEIGMPHAYGNL